MYWERLALVRWRRKGENRRRGREGSRFYPEVVVQSIRRSWLLPYCGQTILTHMYYCLVLYLCTTKNRLNHRFIRWNIFKWTRKGGGGEGEKGEHLFNVPQDVRISATSRESRTQKVEYYRTLWKRCRELWEPRHKMPDKRQSILCAII